MLFYFTFILKYCIISMQTVYDFINQGRYSRSHNSTELYLLSSACTYVINYKP
jgi:hypothetical protein